MRNLPHLVSRPSLPFTRQRWTVDVVAGYLLFLSTLYLAIPHLIFFFGWLRWPLAFLLAGGLILGIIGVWRRVAQLLAPSLPVSSPEDGIGANHRQSFIFTRHDALMIAGIAVIWLTLAGVGGFISQDLDWNKHNMVLNSLVQKPWPTVYEIYQVDVPLVYYIGYYLPAALVGKIGGWFWANQALFGWSLIGLLIAILWFCVLVRRVSYPVLLIFIFFSGLDVVGKALATYGRVWNISEKDWQHIDSWTGIWQYSSHATLLNWVPNQGLSGWIAMGMTLYCFVTPGRRDLILLPFGLSALWSPFVTLGLLPYLVLDFLMDHEPWAARLRRTLSLPNVAGLLALAITGFYFSAKAAAGSPIVIQSMLSGLSLEYYAGPALDAIAFLLIFCLLEFGLYAIILYRGGAVQGERWRLAFDITVLSLCILPWFKLGVYNDLVMRASIPALFALAVIVARAICDPGLARQTRNALLVVLLAGAVTSAIEFRRHLVRMVTLPAPLTDERTQRWDFVYYMQRQTFFFGQYAGGMDAPFFQYAAKPISDEARTVAGSEEEKLNRHDFLLYGNQVYLLRDTVGLPAEIRVGETVTVPVQLHFFGPAIVQPYAPSLRLVDESGATVWARDGWPLPPPEISPFWMTHWTPAVTVTVPLTATPGVYALELGFYGGEDGEYLVAHSVPAGEPLGAIVPVTNTVVVRRNSEEN